VTRPVREFFHGVCEITERDLVWQVVRSYHYTAIHYLSDSEHNLHTQRNNNKKDHALKHVLSFVQRINGEKNVL